MSDARSAAAQAGYVDVELLLFNCAKAFTAAKTQAELDAEWANGVRPVYDQLSERSLSILSALFELKSALIMTRR